MKKTVTIILVLLLFVPSFAFSASLSNKSEKKISEISDAAENMDATMRVEYYNANKKNPVGPVLLNLGLGFGIGSFVQGDTTGGIVGLVGDVASYGILGYGIYTMAEKVTNHYTSEDVVNSLVVIGVGSLLKIGFTVYEATRASNYARLYNRELSSAITNAPFSVSFLPVIDKENNMGVAFAARVDL